MHQRISIIGNLGKDPEMRYMQDGTAVCSLNIATNRKYNDKQGNLVKETTWFRVSVWGKQAENCNLYLKKGSLVMVEGRLQADKATGGPRLYQRKDGGYGAQFEITADAVRFLGATQEQDESTQEQEADESMLG